MTWKFIGGSIWHTEGCWNLVSCLPQGNLEKTIKKKVSSQKEGMQLKCRKETEKKMVP